MENNKDVILEELIKKDADESSTAYSAFLFWANLSAAERRNEDAMMRAAEHVGLELSTMRVYRVDYHWEERVNLIDAHFFRINYQKRLALTNESNQKFASETKFIQEEAVKVAKLALIAARQVLETFPMANKVVETDFVYTKDGKKVATKTEIKMDAKLSDAATLLRVAVETPMKAIGLPTEVVRPSALPTTGGAITQKSDADLAEERRLIQDEIRKILGETQELSTLQ